MKRVTTLEDFVKNIIKYLGSGYKYYKVVRIPAHKQHKIAEICTKIQNKYNTSLSRGKKQYRRKKDLCNYGAVNYRDIIILLRTEGNNNDKENEFKQFKKNITVEISEHLTIVFFRNEHKRITVKLDKQTYRRFREDFYIAIKNNNGRNYNKLKAMWRNLPRFKGIGVQGSNLHKYISEKLKTFERNWQKLYN